MPTWIGIEATLLPDENEKDGLRSLQKSITDYQQEEQKAYSQSKWAKSTPVKSMIEEMEACTTLTEIQSFRFTIKNADEQAVYETKLTELTPKN